MSNLNAWKRRLAALTVGASVFQFSLFPSSCFQTGDISRFFQSVAENSFVTATEGLGEGLGEDFEFIVLDPLAELLSDGVNNIVVRQFPVDLLQDDIVVE